MWHLLRRDDLHIALWTVLLLSTIVLARAR
jgi:hypothetical protein